MGSLIVGLCKCRLNSSKLPQFLTSFQHNPVKMSAYLSTLSFSSIFGSIYNTTAADDGFWQEPSTIKAPLTAAASVESEAGGCDGTATPTTKHTIAHRRNKSLQLHYAAPTA